ncbi:MAG: PH domain-containing protein [Pseudomonadota bacterium]
MTDTDQVQTDDGGVLDWQPLSARFLPRVLAGEALTVVAVGICVPLAAAFAGRSGAVPGWAWLLLPAYLALQLAVLPPAIRRAGFALRRDDLQFRKGLFVHRRKAVPLRRVQHVETLRGPLDRAFGLSTLKLYTAAAGSGNLTIQGLDRSTADALRHTIVERVRDEPDADD